MNAAEVSLGLTYSPTTLQIFTSRRNLRILLNVVPLLTLGIMGGAILPVPSAFATTGIISATVSMLIIAACMIYTSDLLVWQSYCLGVRDYETLSQAVGGKWYRIFTEIWLIILMIGTLLGSIVQVGEVCASGILLVSSNPPGALVNGSGRVIMVIAVIAMSAFIFLRNLRQLELFGDAGIVVVFIMVVVIMVHSIQQKLPAIDNGFAITGFSDLDTFGSALSTFGFMFYIQPVLMSFFDEMPPGEYGVKMMQWSARLAIGGTAFVMYYLAGFFGAAAFGQDTEGNILQNKLGSNDKALATLNFFMAAYIAIGLVPFEWACRHSVDSLVIQAFPKLNQEKYVLARKVGEGFLVYGVSLGIALAIPGQSAKIIAVTGATGVLLVCYFIPLLNHYLLWFGKAQCQKDPSLLAGIVKPVKGTVTEKLMDDSAHLGKISPHSDPEALPAGLGVATPGFYGDGEHKQLPYVYTTMPLPSRIFHLVIPPVVLAVGAFASALTLKSLADD